MAMTSADVVKVTERDGALLIEMDNPPVNALGIALRRGLMAAFERLARESALKGAVLTGTGRFFSAGADISEFGKTRENPLLPELIVFLEDLGKPVVAAINGQALGGGLELAVGCHYRIAAPAARMGLPEVKLGLLPGAGGTQRLPRLIGVERALAMIVTGEPIDAAEAKTLGLVDEVAEGDLIGAAFRLLEGAIAQGIGQGGVRPPRTRDREEKLAVARADSGLIDRIAEPLLKRQRGLPAPRACVEAVRAAVTLPFEEGLKREVELFAQLVNSPESKAQRHIFFAEREAAKLPDMPADVRPRDVNKAVVIGAGTMGGGIAMSFANFGIPVWIIDQDQESLDRGLARIRENYQITVSRGSLAADEMEKRLARIHGTTDWSALAEGDVVIEAVFEELDLKQRIFRMIDEKARPGALLATNTSTLDVNKIAAATSRPQDVIGMHFFSPANVMRLLEIVRASKTSFQAIATAIAIGRRIGKVPAVVGVCDGFVGNRMLHRRTAQAERLLLEGALPQDVDQAVVAFGFPMGPFAMGDLAGLDVGWRIRKARGTKAPISDALCEAGRFGQKTGAGYYRYEKGSRTPIPDPEVERIIIETSKRLGITRRPISAEEITERMIYPMINEGARILEERIAMRASDIDVIWVYGYGWPVWRGGPMYYADQVGLGQIEARLKHYAETLNDETLRPAALLSRLATEGKGFSSLPVQPIAV
jgi:3-hydroxyacyl-CoA dehydrogenase